MDRMTARAFRARFNKVSEPTLVGNGIWFPEASAELMAIAESAGGTVTPLGTIVKSAPFGPFKKVDAVSKTVVSPGATETTFIRPRMDLSKTAQAKGKMGHR